MLVIRLLLIVTFFITVEAVTRRQQETCFRENKVPVEGFKRKNCIPGHYDGSCLLIFHEKVTFREAYSICHFDYGGRLATADSEDVFKKWMKRIYRDYEFEVDKDTRFWIGYGNESFYEVQPVGELVKLFFEMNYSRTSLLRSSRDRRKTTNKAFDGRNLTIDLPWEDNAEIYLLENNPCGDYGTVFNSNNGKFDVQKVRERHSFLCETPRYPKFKCPSGWHLIPENRMCILVKLDKVTFSGAYHGCRSEEAFPAIAVKFSEIIILNAICALHNIGDTEHDIIWSGLKLSRREVHSLDGTKNFIEYGGNNIKCSAYFGHWQESRLTLDGDDVSIEAD